MAESYREESERARVLVWIGKMTGGASFFCLVLFA